MIKELVKDSAGYLPTAIVPAIVGFISVPILTHIFEPGDYGDYNIVLSTVSIFSILNAWISMSVLRFFPTYDLKGEADYFTRNVMSISLISILVSSLVFLGVLFGIRFRRELGLRSMMYIGVVLLALSSLCKVTGPFLRSKRRVGCYSIFVSWESIMAMVFGLMFVKFFHFGLEGMLLGTILAMLTALPFLWMKTFGKMSPLPLRVSGPLVWEMAKYGLPLVIGSLDAWILDLSDRYVLKFVRSNLEVGIYCASYNISQRSITLIVSLFLMALTPLILRVWEKEGGEATRKQLNRTMRLFLMVSIPAVVGLSVLAKPLMGLLTREAYLPGYRVMPLVACGAFFLGLQQIYQKGFQFYRKTLPVMMCLIGAAILNIGLNLLLIPAYGYMAAAATTFTSYAVLLVLIVSFSKKYFVWPFPWVSFLKIAVASGIMGALSYYIGNARSSSVRLNLVLSVCSGVIVYFASLLVLREIKIDELRKLCRIHQAS